MKRLCLVVVTVTLVACDDARQSITGPGGTNALTNRIETTHYVFLHADGDRVDADLQEFFHDWVVRELQLAPSRKIEFRKYRNRAHMGELTGHGDTNGYADRTSYVAHSIWSADTHEAVHLYVAGWGDPVALLSEGVAVAYAPNPMRRDNIPRWSDRPVHDAARALLNEGRLIALNRLAPSAAFRLFDAEVTYPQAGSFVTFLIERYGLDRFRVLYAQVRADDRPTDIETTFTAVYGATLAELETSWRTALATPTSYGSLETSLWPCPRLPTCH